MAVTSELADKVGKILTGPGKFTYSDQELQEIIQVLGVIRAFHESREPGSYTSYGITLELGSFERMLDSRNMKPIYQDPASVLDLAEDPEVKPMNEADLEDICCKHSIDCCCNYCESLRELRMFRESRI